MYITLKRRVKIHLILGIGLAAMVSGVGAKEWPNKPIRVVSPYAAGGVGDIILRLLAPALQAGLGQPLVIDNKSGAAGNIGTADVVRARPDGYTLLFAPTANFAVNQYLFKNLGFDPATQLEPITTVAEAPLIAVTSAAGRAKTFKELASQARGNLGKFNYGSPGAGSPTHLAGASFSQMTGNSLVHVTYRGTPPLVQGLLTDEVQLAFPTLTPVAGNLRAGKLKALAVLARQRIPSLPDVPTTAEAGFPDLIFGNWWVLAAPKGTDPKIIARLAHEIHAALADPALRARLDDIGHVPVGLGPAESVAFMRSESARYKALIERAGIKLDQ